MRFKLVEELTSGEVDKIRNSADYSNMSDVLGKFNKTDRKGNRAIDKMSPTEFSRLIGKSGKSSEKALDGIDKIKNVKDIFAQFLLDGVDSPRFQFLCKLPDEAYQNRDNLEYFAKKLSDGSIGVPSSVTATESLTEAVGGELIVPYDSADSLYMYGGLWGASNFKDIVDTYSKLNNKSNASKMLGAISNMLGKPMEAKGYLNGKPAILSYFVDDNGNIANTEDMGNSLAQSIQHGKKEQARLEREAGKMSVDDIAKQKDYHSYNMLLGLIKDYHGKLLTSKYKNGSKTEKYYTTALKRLGDNLKAKASGEKLGEIEKGNADFLEKFFTEKRYTKVSPFKILSDFEMAVDKAVAEERIGMPKKKKPEEAEG